MTHSQASVYTYVHKCTYICLCPHTYRYSFHICYGIRSFLMESPVLKHNWLCCVFESCIYSWASMQGDKQKGCFTSYMINSAEKRVKADQGIVLTIEFKMLSFDHVSLFLLCHITGLRTVLLALITYLKQFFDAHCEA